MSLNNTTEMSNKHKIIAGLSEAISYAKSNINESRVIVFKGPEDETDEEEFIEIEDYEPQNYQWDYDNGFEDEDDTECDLIKEDWRD